MFLERSKNHPLQLTFSFDISIALLRTSGFDEALGALARHSERWGRVRFHVRGSFFKHPAFHNISHRVPALHTLDIQHTDTNLALQTLGSIPSLRSFHLTISNAIPDCIHIPWSQLRSLNLELCQVVFSMKNFVTLFRGLRWLKLSVSDCRFDDGEDNPKHHEICDIESLILDVTPPHPTAVAPVPEPNATGPFLARMSLPRLSSLELQGYRPRFESCSWNAQPLFSLLDRSACMITSLSLILTSISDQQTVHLLRLMPGLRSLKVVEQADDPASSPITTPARNAIVTPHLLGKLVVRGEVGVAAGAPSPQADLVLQLNKLEVSVNSSDLDVDAFYEAVVSRRLPDPNIHGDGSLRSVRVTFIDPIENIPESCIALQRLSDEGLHVSIALGNRR
ncbi:hypothetical protein V5O48_018856 [Marasmius crinis-equi]|uniref:Uncharacterized protein n=1 Tax=Marasmius crinis-equi TaxID=585013 RepID=A0ABR3EJZ1_9AGAR